MSQASPRPTLAFEYHVSRGLNSKNWLQANSQLCRTFGIMALGRQNTFLGIDTLVCAQREPTSRERKCASCSARWAAFVASLSAQVFKMKTLQKDLQHGWLPGPKPTRSMQLFYIPWLKVPGLLRPNLLRPMVALLGARPTPFTWASLAHRIKGFLPASLLCGLVVQCIYL